MPESKGPVGFATSDWLAVATMLGGATTLWLITRSYHGIYHDARLYSLQALARLNPEALGQDVFLRYGSQDSFTIFSPVYAIFIAWLGLENAARLLTLLGHFWWFAAIWFLARSFLNRRHAALSVALVAALPGYYGAWDVFRYAEPFLTPRLFAEASILSALACVIRSRPVAASGFAMLAASLHPLMAAGGVVLVAWMLVRGRLNYAVPSAVLVGLALACLLAIYAPVYPLSQIDDAWMHLLRMRSPFLFLQDWGPESWEGALTALIGLLILGSAWPEGEARELFLKALGVGILGIVITAVGASYFEVALLTQGQGWRWTWLACALLGIAAVVGLPAAWSQGSGARAALYLLGAAWGLVHWPAITLLLAAAATWLVRSHLRGSIGRAIELIAVAIMVSAIIAWFLNLPPLTATTSTPSAPPARPLMVALENILSDGVLSVVFVVALWMLARRYERSFAPPVCAIAMAALFALGALPDWLRHDYRVIDPEVTEHWTRRIPPTAEVFSPEDPGFAWYILGRRSFLSMDQTAGVVFSRAAALEMRDRARSVSLVLPPDFAFGASQARSWQLSATTLTRTCLKSAVDFVIYRRRFEGVADVRPIRVKARRTGIEEHIYLYDCAARRAHAANPTGTHSLR